MKKILGSGYRYSSSDSHINNTIVTISNNEKKDIMKIVKSFENSGLLFKGFSKTIQNEAKGQRGGFLGMLSGILGANKQSWRRNCKSWL